MTDTPLPGNPTVWGNKKAQVLDHVGPNPYTAGGEVFDAVHLGWSGLEWVDLPNGQSTAALGNTKSGNYNVRVIYDTASVIDGALSSVKLQWFVAAGGAEAGAIDLSAEVIRMLVTGI